MSLLLETHAPAARETVVSHVSRAARDPHATGFGAPLLATLLAAERETRELLDAAPRIWVVTKANHVETDAELSARTREVDRNGSLVLRVTR